MTTQITWIIEQMQVAPQLDGQTDVVVVAAWRCNGVDGEYAGTVYGATSFNLSQGSTFTPYDQITEQQVLDWCYENGVDKTATEANVELQIQNQINPPVVVLPLPWSNQ